MKLDFRHGAYSTMSQRFVAGFESLNDAKIFAAKLFIPDIKENEIVIVRDRGGVLEPYVKDDNLIRFESASHYDCSKYVSFRPTHDYDEEVFCK